MLTVRFPDGTSLQYNTARHIQKVTGGWHLYETKTADNSCGGWVAFVPESCVIEARAACQVYNPVTNPKSALRYVMDHLREMSGYDLADLKSRLHYFNAQKREWKK